MYIFIAIGALIAIINVILTWTELKPFRIGLQRLNGYTKSHSDTITMLLYLPRFLTLLPKLTPLLIDGAIAFACSSIGLGGGVIGSLIGLCIGFTVSLIIKISRYSNKSKKQSYDSWN